MRARLLRDATQQSPFEAEVLGRSRVDRRSGPGRTARPLRLSGERWLVIADPPPWASALPCTHVATDPRHCRSPRGRGVRKQRHLFAVHGSAVVPPNSVSTSFASCSASAGSASGPRLGNPIRDYENAIPGQPSPIIILHTTSLGLVSG